MKTCRTSSGNIQLIQGYGREETDLNIKTMNPPANTILKITSCQYCYRGIQTNQRAEPLLHFSPSTQGFSLPGQRGNHFHRAVAPPAGRPMSVPGSFSPAVKVQLNVQR